MDSAEFKDANTRELAEDGGERVGRNEGLGTLMVMAFFVTKKTESVDFRAESRRRDGGYEGEERLETFLEDGTRAETCTDLCVANAKKAKEVVAALLEPGTTDKRAAPEGNCVVRKAVKDAIDELLW
jgi:hypothetical protein